MATFQSDHAKRRKPTHSVDLAGIRVTTIFTYTVPATGIPTAADIIEIGTLPAFGRLVEATIIGAGTGAATAEVGLMTGDAGDAQGVRDLTGTRIFAAATAINNTEATTTKAAALAVNPMPADKDVGIGVKLSAAPTAGGTITLIATYMAD